MATSINESIIQNLCDMANKLRIHSIKMTDASKSGHPTSCCSMAELMSVLFYHVMKYTPSFPKNPNSDRFILSKGHAAPILYAAWAEVGLFPISELLNLRKVDSDLEGHPTPRLSFVDVATGSLGQGLSVAAGIAYVGKYMEKCPYKVYCLMGDGESSEGSVWEAASFSSCYKLDNLVAIIDINRLAQSDTAPLGHDLDTYEKRWSAFGFATYKVDGHCVQSILNAFQSINSTFGQPSVILAKTFKGYGITGVSDMMGWHGKSLGKLSEAAIEEISCKIVNKNISGKDVYNAKLQTPPTILKPNNFTNITFKLSSPPNYQLGQKVATRLAYGIALAKLGEANEAIIAIDADVKNSTFSDKFKAKFPNRFIDCFIAEQNMIGVAVGAGTRDRFCPFASTFAAFLSRAFDQIRMAAISYSKIKLCGSHVGVSIGEDGASQMALEDIALFRSIPNSVVFYPSDAVSMERAVELAAGTNGIAYIRSSRPETPVIYKCDEIFEIGKAKIVRQTNQDNICMVGAGVTLNEIMKAATLLKEIGVSPRVIDPFTIKPIDKVTLLEAARACGGRVVTVEDHYIEGGIFEAVSSALAPYTDVSVIGIAVNDIPHSGKPDELLDKYGISAEKIAKTIKGLKF